MKLLLLFAALAAAWIDDQSLKNNADDRTWTAVPKFVVDLDAPAADRWTHIGSLYKDKAPALIAYLETMVPAWALPILETIGNDIEPFFTDYGEEMKGLASAMGLKLGDVVILNLVYQLEHIGLNCSNWNNTGPTIPNDPGCMAVDPTQTWCYCHNNSDLLTEDQVLWSKQRTPEDGPGLCTSVVAEDTTGSIWHGRNLDWNLPKVLLEMAIDVSFQRNNQTVFMGTTLVGFVGLLNGIRTTPGGGCPGFSVSIDARDKGGKLLENLLEALLHKKAMTPSQHLRKAFESAPPTFDAAVKALAPGPLVNEVYYIMAGCQAGEGVVVSRDRDDNGLTKVADLWRLNSSDPTGWFRLQTNYDHWNPVPQADDRRTPGNAAMQSMGQSKLGEDPLRAVMQTWPVFNHHTDYTGIWNPAQGLYSSGVWL